MCVKHSLAGSIKTIYPLTHVTHRHVKLNKCHFGIVNNSIGIISAMKLNLSAQCNKWWSMC